MRVVKIEDLESYNFKEGKNKDNAIIDVDSLLKKEIEMIEDDIVEYRKVGDNTSAQRNKDTVYGVQRALQILNEE